MKTRFSVDLVTQKISRFHGGVKVSDDVASIVTARDVMDCEVVVMNDTADITAASVATGQILVLGLRQYTSVGLSLAQSTGFAMVSSVGNCAFSLDTAEVVALINSLSNPVNAVSIWFEVSLENPDGTFRLTLAQQKFSLRGEVNMEGTPSPVALPNYAWPYNRSDVTTLTSGANPLAAVDVSANKLLFPMVLVYLAGCTCLYRLKAKASLVQVLPHLVVSTSDTTYIWELQSISKQGNPCEWSPGDSLFYQRIVQTLGGSPSSSLADTGFALPV